MAAERWDPFKRTLEDSRRDLLKRLEEIESLGDLVVGVEWLPAGGGECSLCNSRAGKTMTIEEARAVLGTAFCTFGDPELKYCRCVFNEVLAPF